MENARNRAILEGVAEAFVDAVLQFCQLPVLQYRWTLYLPEETKISSPFWLQVLTRIKERIKTVPVLWPQTRSRLRLIKELKIVPSNFRDRYGEPLVPDLADENEMYLDREYGPRGHDTYSDLKALGLAVMHVRDCIARIGRDAISSTSKMRLADTDWHERIARILLVAFENSNFKDKIPYLKSLPLIPLWDQQWTSIVDGAVYFSNTNEMPIPSDLGLRLVDSNAVKSEIRKKLFEKIGVRDADKDVVRRLILAKHSRNWDKVTLKISIAHSQYLYWTQPASSSSIRNGLGLRKVSPFCVFDDLGDPVGSSHDLYFETDGENGTKELLALVRQEILPAERNIFGSLINQDYLKPSTPLPARESSTLSFESFLESEVHILRYPRLFDPENRSQLSRIFLFLAEKHPEQMLRTLKSYWDDEYRTALESYPLLKQQIASLKIPCTNVGSMELGKTFIPLKDLEAQCSSFVEPGMFPFLKFDSVSTLEEWKFLETFGVHMESNLDFYLEILRRLKQTNAKLSYQIYEEIQRKIWSSNDRKADAERVWYGKAQHFV